MPLKVQYTPAVEGTQDNLRISMTRQFAGTTAATHEFVQLYGPEVQELIDSIEQLKLHRMTPRERFLAEKQRQREERAKQMKVGDLVLAPAAATPGAI